MIVTLSTGVGSGHALIFKEGIGAFDRLHQITKSKPYSSIIFNDEAINGTNRRASNVQKLGNLLIYDIDEGMTLFNAIGNVRDYQSLIVTSKSHQMPKHDIVGDRFRVLIPLYSDTPLSLNIPKEEYPEFYAFTAHYLGFNSFDKSTKDIARFYYPNPSQEVFYSNSHELLEFEVLYAEFRHHKKLSEAHKRPAKLRIFDGVREVLYKNELPRNQVFEMCSGVTISWSDATSKSTSVKCVFPENHKNGDKNPSAFIVHDVDKENPRFYCSGCGASYWMGAV